MHNFLAMRKDAATKVASDKNAAALGILGDVPTSYSEMISKVSQEKKDDAFMRRLKSLERSGKGV